jgi:protein-S-isoprenylcysteine O-methyltransferase Ste14
VTGLWLAATLAAAAALEHRSPRLAFSPAAALAGLVLVSGGLSLHVWARRALGPLWSGPVEVRPGEPLVERGPYARVRHPIYLALLLLAAGSALAHTSVASLCLAVGLAVGLALKVRLEERALRGAPGDAYGRYASRVPALVPALAPLLRALGRFVGRRRRRYALALGAVLWGGWLVSLLAGPGFLDLAGQVKGADFIQAYAAGRIVVSGQADRLYDLGLQREVEHAITRPQDWPGWHGFLNPPFFALAFVPLALLPYGVAFALWCALGLGLVAAALALVGRVEPAWGARWRAAVPWVLAFVPVFAAVSYGQNSLVSVGLLAGVFVLLRRGRDFAAGLVLGAVLYKPQLALVLALMLLLDRRWRTLLGLAAGGVALGAASWALSPRACIAWAELARSFLAMPRAPGFPAWNMHSLTTFFTLLLPAAPRAAAALALLATGCALVAVRALQPVWGGDGLRRWYAIALWGTALVSPHLFLYDLSLLALAAVLVWPDRRDEDLWIGGMALVWVALLFSGPLARALQTALGPAVQLSVPVVAAVGYQLLRDAARPAADA